MKKIVFSISFLKIRKQEFPEIINGVIGIVNKYNPEMLFIKGMFNLLLELQSKLVLLTDKSISHPLTKVLNKQRKSRLKLVSAILMQGLAMEKAGVSSMAEAVKLIVPVIKMYFANLSRENQKVVHQEVNNFLLKLHENDALASAASTIGVTVYIDELKVITQSIDANINLRRESNSPRRIVNKALVKTEIIDSFNRLLNSIELARVEHPTLDYMPLISELNEFLVPYQSLVKSRNTLSKNAAKKATTVALSTTTTATAI
jgi:hypothetical protein